MLLIVVGDEEADGRPLVLVGVVEAVIVVMHLNMSKLVNMTSW